MQVKKCDSQDITTPITPAPALLLKGLDPWTATFPFPPDFFTSRQGVNSQGHHQSQFPKLLLMHSHEPVRFFIFIEKAITLPRHLIWELVVTRDARGIHLHYKAVFLVTHQVLPLCKKYLRAKFSP